MYNYLGQEMIVPEDDPVTGGQIMIVPEDEDIDEIMDEGEDVDGLGFSWRKLAKFSPAGALLARRTRKGGGGFWARKRAAIQRALELKGAEIQRLKQQLAQRDATIAQLNKRLGVRPMPIKPGWGQAWPSIHPWFNRPPHKNYGQLYPQTPQIHRDPVKETIVQPAVPATPLTKPEVVSMAAKIAAKLKELRAAGLSPSALHVASLNMRSKLMAEARMNKAKAADNAKASDMQGIF